MEIGKLEQHCGLCGIIDYCAEPFSELCLCTDSRFTAMDEEQYLKLAQVSNAAITTQEVQSELEGWEDEDDIDTKTSELLNMRIADDIAFKINKS